MASGSGDGTIRIWNAENSGDTGNVLKCPEDSVKSFALSNDRRLLASGWDNGTLEIFDLASNYGRLVFIISG